MNFKDIENFYNVSEFKSFSLASRMLGVTQPTLSESIKRLESQLETKLFYRSKVGISLTPSGAKTLIYAKELLNSKDLMKAVAKNKSGLSQRFTLGCHATVAGYFLSDLLQHVYKSYSDLSINLEHDHSRNIQKKIQDGQIDIGVIVNPSSNPDLIIKSIATDRVCVWEPQKKKIKKDQIIADIGLPQVQSILRSWKSAPANTISTTDFHLIGELTLSGMGRAILPERFVKQHRLKLKEVFPSKAYKDEFAIVYRPEFGKNEIERFIIDSLKLIIS